MLLGNHKELPYLLEGHKALEVGEIIGFLPFCLRAIKNCRTGAIHFRYNLDFQLMKPKVRDLIIQSHAY